ncbi:MAG: hypothetical protein QM793_00190 [Muricomes sp.]
MRNTKNTTTFFDDDFEVTYEEDIPFTYSFDAEHDTKELTDETVVIDTSLYEKNNYSRASRNKRDNSRSDFYDDRDDYDADLYDDGDDYDLDRDDSSPAPDAADVPGLTCLFCFPLPEKLLNMVRRQFTVLPVLL